MEILSSYITLIDFFGYPLTFKHNQQINYSTTLGGSLTIITAIFLLYSFLHLSRDCLYKLNPSVRETNYYEDYTVVSGKNFFFSFYFTDDKFKQMDEPEKYLIFYGLFTNYTDDINTKTVPFVKCNFEKHFNKTGVANNKIKDKIFNFNHTYCLDIDEDFNFINSGTEIPRHSLSIFVIECANKTIDNVDYQGRCAPKQQIDRKLSSFMVNSYFFNSYLRVDDIHNPNKANIKKESLIVSNHHACDKLFITYKQTSLSIDYGFLFESPILMENIQISNYVPDQVPHTRDILGYNIIYNIEIDANHFRTLTFVKFQKIQEALSSIGGILSIIKLIFGLAMLGINKFGFPFSLFSDVYLNGEDIITYDPYKVKKNNVINIFKNLLRGVDNSKSLNWFTKKAELLESKNHSDNNNKIDVSENGTSKGIIRDTLLREVYKDENEKNIHHDLKNFEETNTKNFFDKGKEIDKFSIKQLEINKYYSSNKDNDIRKSKENRKRKFYYSKQNKFAFNMDFLVDGKKRSFNKMLELENKNIVSNINNNNSIVFNNDKEIYENYNQSPFHLINNKDEKYKNDLSNNMDSFRKLKGNISDANLYENLNHSLRHGNINYLKEKSNFQDEINNKSQDDNNIPINIDEIEMNKNNFNKNQIIESNNHKKSNNSHEKSEKNQIKKKKTINFRPNFPTLVYAFCCRKKLIMDPIELILEKIDKELEIVSYVRMKEDLHIIKDLLIDPKDQDMFNKPLEFQEIYDAIKTKYCNYEGLNNYFMKSFSSNVINKRDENKNKRNLKELEKQFHMYRMKYTFGKFDIE